MKGVQQNVGPLKSYFLVSPRPPPAALPRQSPQELMAVLVAKVTDANLTETVRRLRVLRCRAFIPLGSWVEHGACWQGGYRY